MKKLIPQSMAPHLLRTIHSKWWLCLAISFLALISTIWPEGLMHLRYDRNAALNDEIWRIATAHLVHLSTPHLLLDLLGLVLICELLWNKLPLLHGIGLLGFSAIAISGALWWLHPEITWYVGLSGVLHGLWAACVLYELGNSSANSSQKLICLIGALLLVAKLVWELQWGPSENTIHLIGGNVITASHLYGALAGAVYIVALGCVRMRSLSQGALQQE